MSVDKFGHHLNKIKKVNLKRPTFTSCALSHTKDGHLDVHNKIIKNVMFPVDNDDVASKKYVDKCVTNCDIKVIALTQLVKELCNKAKTLEDEVFKIKQSKTNKK